jgi:hypothetical protein
MADIARLLQIDGAEIAGGRQVLRLMGDGIRRRLVEELARRPQPLGIALMEAMAASRANLYFRLSTLERGGLVQRARNRTYHLSSDTLVATRRYVDLLITASSMAGTH